MENNDEIEQQVNIYNCLMEIIERLETIGAGGVEICSQPVSLLSAIFVDEESGNIRRAMPIEKISVRGFVKEIAGAEQKFAHLSLIINGHEIPFAARNSRSLCPAFIDWEKLAIVKMKGMSSIFRLEFSCEKDLKIVTDFAGKAVDYFNDFSSEKMKMAVYLNGLRNT